MRMIRSIGTLAVAAMAFAGCEDITNPVEEAGEFAPPFVRFTSASSTGAHGSMNPVVFDVPPRPEEDVEIDFTFTGNAVFGEDFVVVNSDGTPRGDVSAAGGTVIIEADPAATEPHDTLWIMIPPDAVVGRVVEVQMTDARTASGGAVTLGRLGDFDVFDLTITAAPAEIPEGSYSGSLSGDLSGATTVTITASDGSFDYEISDIAAGAFGIPIAWELSVLSDGTTQWSETPRDFDTLADIGMTGGITGEYDFDTNTLTWNVQYTDTFSWSGTATLD